jgi:hypothetical protein
LCPRSLSKRPDDRYAVRGALCIERFDAVNTGRGIQVFVRMAVSAFVVVLGRLLQVELQTVRLTNRVEPFPRLAEGETELLVVADRAGKSSTRNCGAKDVTRGFVLVVVMSVLAQ